MGTETNNREDRTTPEYLAQLLKDRKQISAFPNVFIHVEKLLDEGECIFMCVGRRQPTSRFAKVLSRNELPS